MVNLQSILSEDHLAPQTELVFSGIRCNAFLIFYIKHKQFRPQMCRTGWPNLVFLADFLADVPANLQKLAIFGRRSFKETNYLFQNIYLFYKRLPKIHKICKCFGTSAKKSAKNTRFCQPVWHICGRNCLCLSCVCDKPN